jgi:ABC-2 type transport system permease protein
MTRGFTSVAGAVVRRSLTHAFKNPALLVPSLVFPLLFLVAFAGGLSNLGKVPGFDFPSGYTAFQFVFVFLQSAAFGGVFTGFTVAADFETGFARRLLLGAPRREGIVAGYAAAALVRWLATATVVTVAALLAGMQVDGGGVQLVGLVTLGLLVNVAAVLWGAGVAMRFKTLQAGPLMQIPVFLVLFLAPVYVPLDLLTGWIGTLASINPATAFLEAGRGFISGVPDVVGLAYLAGFALVLVGSAWALTGLRRAERGE